MFNIRLPLFGDSILKGVVSDASRRYRILKQNDELHLDEEMTVTLVNQSHFGYTLTRGEEVLQRYLDKGTESRVMILEYGGNDADFNWAEINAQPEAEHLPNTPLEQFITTYERIITTLREKQITPVLMNLPPLCAERYFDTIVAQGNDPVRIMRWLGDVEIIYRHQELYSLTVERIARRLDTLLIDVRGAFLKRFDILQLIGPDGIHPNEAGHQLMRGEAAAFMSQNRQLLLPA